MALFGKKENEVSTPVAKSPPPAKATPKEPKADMKLDTTYFGKNLKITGSVSGEGSSIIQGSFEGELNLNGQLKISQGARIRGNLKAADIYVNGNVEGTIAASKKLHVDNTAKIKGRIITPKISVQEGSVFDGEIQMSNQSAQMSKPATPAPKQAAVAATASEKK